MVSLKIGKDFIDKILLVFIVLVPMAYSSIEVTLTISILLFIKVIMDVHFKYSNTLVNTILPLGLIFIIATFTCFFYNAGAYDILKDVAYLSKPILFVLFGFYFTKKISDKDFIFKLILLLGVSFAIYHLYWVMRYLLLGNFSIAMLRTVCGKSNYVELIAVVFLLTGIKTSSFKLRADIKKLLLLLFAVSFIFYFSRTMVLGLAIFYFSIKGYTKFTKKGAMYLSALLLIIISFFAFLQTIETDRESEGLNGFLFKLKNAPSEIFSAKIDKNNHAELWDHWRAYEASMAFKEMHKQRYSSYFVGLGLGALVDLEFIAPLNREGIRYIPILHNGFAYILFKTGIFGLILYLLFLIYLYLQAYQKKGEKAAFFTNTISGIGIYFFFTTIIITGIYNQGDIFTIFLGAFIYLKGEFISE